MKREPVGEKRGTEVFMPTPKQQGTTPAHQQYGVMEEEPKKATFYLSPEAMNALHTLWLQTKSTKKGRRLSKSKMVNRLIDKANANLHGKDVDGN